jgi:predicted acylesterase/phospholipase RssA
LPHKSALTCSLALLMAVSSCTGPKPVVVPVPEPEKPAAPPRPETITLVLSVGGNRGLAHIGAIDAIKQRGIKIHSVFGNSMGAVIGGLYATSPSSDLASRYRALIAAVQKRTEEATPVYRKLAIWLRLTVPEFGNREFEMAMRDVFGPVAIERLPIRFATSYKVRAGNGVRDVNRISGDLAEAIARSANNPFIFKNAQLVYIDPGMDRMSAIPVEDAFRTFQPDRVIAVNATGDPMFHSRDVNCAIDEVKLVIPEFNPGEELSGNGKNFEMLYRVGFDCTMEVLKRLPGGVVALGNLPKPGSKQIPSGGRDLLPHHSKPVEVGDLEKQPALGIQIIP